MHKNKIKVIANLPNGYESNNRIYSPNGGGEPLQQEIGRMPRKYW